MLSIPQGLAPDAATAPKRAFDVALADGATVRVRTHGRGPGHGRLVLSHGNGLAIDGYRPFWSLLADRHEVVVFDFRHHGLSSPYRGPMQNWPCFIADFGVILAAIERELGPAPSVGVFHSLSSLTALLHAAAHAAPWRGLVAFEPPTPPYHGHPEFEPFFELHRNLAEDAASRREGFAAVEDLAASFVRSGYFRRFDPAGLHALAAANLRCTGQQRYTLACARAFESETFRMRNLEGAWQRIASVTLPVCIVAGIPGPDENPSLCNVSRSLAADSGFECRTVEDATHLLQLERPRECAAIVAAFVARVLSKAEG